MIYFIAICLIGNYSVTLSITLFFNQISNPDSKACMSTDISILSYRKLARYISSFRAGLAAVEPKVGCHISQGDVPVAMIRFLSIPGADRYTKSSMESFVSGNNASMHRYCPSWEWSPCRPLSYCFVLHYTLFGESEVLVLSDSGLQVTGPCD